MHLLPVQRSSFTTHLTETEVIGKLSENLEFRLPALIGKQTTSYSKRYSGWILGGNFELSRIIKYRNSFSPLIKGKIYKASDTTKVDIVMTLHPFVKLFMAFWLGSLSLASILLLIASFRNQFHPEVIITLGMLLFGLTLAHVAFKIEADASRKDFLQMLNATAGKPGERG